MSRLNDPVTGPIILIQQRVHDDDLAGMLLRQGGWTHLDLPAIAEEPVQIDLGRRGSVSCKPGDLLYPDRLPRDLLEQQQAELGSYVFAAQYQQRPAPLEGGIVKWAWFRTYDQAPLRNRGDRIVQSWDTASRAEEAHDYSVCTTWLLRGPNAWLLEVHRARLEFPELRRRIEDQARLHGAITVLIEQAGSGLQLIQDLKRRSRLNIVGIIPKGDKPTRLLGVSPMIEGGRVAIPEDAPWLAEFRREVTLFPNGKHDDQVDSLSQFLTWMNRPWRGAMSGMMA
ncbi:phage terminase large subunit [Lutimaribacter marinistellae]|uniref:Phage terminase large subunit n=1 Tax=Lutimaribacter marinistellae TaxID=1820329 RepID=A0ABV7TI39_9RHOB